MDQGQLRDDLIRLFNSSVLQGICRQLQVDYAALPGIALADKVRELVVLLKANGRLPELVQEMVNRYPELATKYQPYLQNISSTTAEAADERPLGDTLITMKWQTAVYDTDGEGTHAQAWITQQTTKARRQGLEDVTTDLSHLYSQAAGRSSLPNPYAAGPAVTDPTLFWGRQAERSYLRDHLLNFASTAIVGPHRMGKSSLLYHISHHEPLPAEQNFLFAYLDLQNNAYHTLSGLLNGAFQQWVAHIAAADNPPYLQNMADFSRWVQALRVRGYRPVLCLDDMDRLARQPQLFNDDLLATWQALGSSGQMVFITVSQHPLADLIRQAGLTVRFHNIFHTLDLGLLTPDAASNLLTLPLAHAGLVAPAGATEALLHWCGPHPFYLQMAAAHLFNGLAVQSYSWATVREAFTIQAEPHWRELWTALSPAQQSAFSVAGVQPLPPHVARQARILARLGLLVGDEALAYRPFSHGFAAWLATLYPNPPAANSHSPRQLSEQPPAALPKRGWLDRLLGRS